MVGVTVLRRNPFYYIVFSPMHRQGEHSHHHGHHYCCYVNHSSNKVTRSMASQLPPAASRLERLDVAARQPRLHVGGINNHHSIWTGGTTPYGMTTDMYRPIMAGRR